MNNMSEQDPRETFFRELAISMIEPVEDTLSDFNIKVPDSDRTGDDSEAALYGAAYYGIEGEMVDRLKTRFGTPEEQKTVIELRTRTQVNQTEAEADELFNKAEIALGIIPFVPPLSNMDIQFMSQEQINKELTDTLMCINQLILRYRIIKYLSEDNLTYLKAVLNGKFDITIDCDLLEKQIIALLESNIPEDSKTGLHSLLGIIYDHLTSGEICQISDYLNSTESLSQR